MKIKKFFLLIMIVCLIHAYLHSAEKQISDTKNEFGGVTETFILDSSDRDYDQFTQVSFLYDENGQRRKAVYTFSPRIEKETGYSFQEEFYENGKITAYRMIYSEETSKIRGVKEIIEKLDEHGQTTELLYSNGNGYARTSATSFTLNYPLYSLSFLESAFELEQNSQNAISMSAAYKLARTFVHFKGGYSDLNDDEIEAISYFGYTFANSNPNMVDLYTCKSTAISEGKEYTVYIQESLLPYLQDDMDFLMAYGVMGLDGKLVLLMTEFSEIY